MTNFDFLDADEQFTSFSSIAKEAELVYPASAKASALMCRSSMEAAVKWMYSVDSSLVMPYNTRLVTLIESNSFTDMLPDGMYQKLSYLRRLGNNASHEQKAISKTQAAQGLRHLFDFLDFLAYNYAEEYTAPSFDDSVLQGMQDAAAGETRQTAEEGSGESAQADKKWYRMRSLYG